MQRKLLYLSKIEEYCVCGDGIYSFDEKGTLYMLIVEKEDLNLACIEFLKMNGNIIFTNWDELEKYQQKLVSEYRSQNQPSGNYNTID